VTWEGSCLTHKHYIGLDRPVRSKQCSLLGQFLGYKGKKFCEYAPINSVVAKDSQILIFFVASPEKVCRHNHNHDFLTGLMWLWYSYLNDRMIIFRSFLIKRTLTGITKILKNFFLLLSLDASVD
jgi:hypothetical protein